MPYLSSISGVEVLNPDLEKPIGQGVTFFRRGGDGLETACDNLRELRLLGAEIRKTDTDDGKRQLAARIFSAREVFGLPVDVREREVRDLVEPTLAEVQAVTESRTLGVDAVSVVKTRKNESFAVIELVPDDKESLDAERIAVGRILGRLAGINDNILDDRPVDLTVAYFDHKLGPTETSAVTNAIINGLRTDGGLLEVTLLPVEYNVAKMPRN